MGAVSRQLWTCSTPAREVSDPVAASLPHAVTDAGRSAACADSAEGSRAPGLTIRCVTFNMNSCLPLNAGALLELLVSLLSDG